MTQSPNFPIKQVEQHFKRVMQYAPVMLGNDAVNFFLDSFKYQAWRGANGWESWKPRKVNSKWGKTKRNKGRALLVDTGKLRRSIRIVEAHFMQVTIGTDVPYARAHNEGVRLGEIQNVKGYWRKQNRTERVRIGKSDRYKDKRVYDRNVWVGQHTRRINQNIPRRQFMGDSPYLTRQLNRRLEAELSKALRTI